MTAPTCARLGEGVEWVDAQGPDLFGATLPAPATFPVDGAGAGR